ncbi:hypothetical protein NEOLEDRAFT_752519 [Neolentinus lepideus HHB14362 ss-1]|uniref:Uncharacterized protein n=1 Tax=Neolentinus lepideus HHB14362 ss-1 TaxID=1314782 RepID=A0A165PUR8_9AGAM|nr:hypothetical protein NEOLEDRAFT_752519 [Neolentinus lepideus HHB14362 ss-1]
MGSSNTDRYTHRSYGSASIIALSIISAVSIVTFSNVWAVSPRYPMSDWLRLDHPLTLRCLPSIDMRPTHGNDRWTRLRGNLTRLQSPSTSMRQIPVLQAGNGASIYLQGSCRRTQGKHKGQGGEGSYGQIAAPMILEYDEMKRITYRLFTSQWHMLSEATLLVDAAKIGGPIFLP